MIPGKFISIEGTEGAGKTTVFEFIKKYFAQAKIDALWTREPGGTPASEAIRQILLANNEEDITPMAELLLMFAAREQHMQHVILPALHSGKWVVSDRFIDASYAYQGGGREIPMDEIKQLDKWIVGSTYPDLTLLLDIPPELGFERTKKRAQAKDRIEQEEISFFEKVRNVYLERSAQEPHRIKIIDASCDLPKVEKQIQQALNEFIGKH